MGLQQNSAKDQTLIGLFRELDEQAQEALVQSVRAQVEFHRRAIAAQTLPEDRREEATYRAFAQLLRDQGVKVIVEEDGTMRLDAGEVSAPLEGMSEEERRKLAQAIFKLQQEP